MYLVRQFYRETKHHLDRIFTELFKAVYVTNVELLNNNVKSKFVTTCSIFKVYNEFFHLENANLLHILSSSNINLSIWLYGRRRLQLK